MPRSAPRPCREPHCPELVNNREGFCKDHLKEQAVTTRGRHRKYNLTRGSDPEELKLLRFYRTSKWRNLRNAYISRNPTCELCSQLGRLTVGTVVDHIAERRDGGSDLDFTNLQTLCHRCHTIKTNEEKKRRVT